jgi:hypothetical protein
MNTGQQGAFRRAQRRAGISQGRAAITPDPFHMPSQPTAHAEYALTAILNIAEIVFSSASQASFESSPQTRWANLRNLA